ncbi:MAG: hypothetical protein MZV63_48250 [Marinilabiliales bacterium]|nr:hypothetical protein [Marinilabiliales bacterium]
MKSYFGKNGSLLLKRTSHFRFRDQFTIHFHLPLKSSAAHWMATGNIAGPALAYLKPQGHAAGYVDKQDRSAVKAITHAMLSVHSGP